MTNFNINIRKASPEDNDQIWEVIQKVIAKGDTYVFAPDSSKEKMLNFWCGEDKHTYVAIMEDQVVGTFFLKENQQDLGSHVANAGFITSPEHSGKGIGKIMGEFSLKEAKQLGFQSMQFNMVVKTNKYAIRLWKKLGFKIAGEIPEAFNHKELGLTDAYIMWRKL